MADKRRLTHIIELEIIEYRVIVKGFNPSGAYTIYHDRKTGKVMVEDFVPITKDKYKELKTMFKGKYIAEDNKK